MKAFNFGNQGRVWLNTGEYQGDLLSESEGRYCTKCKSLCSFYEQGLSCGCGHPWDTEVYDEKDSPEEWIEVVVRVYKGEI